MQLTEFDPSIFAKCLHCDPRGRGVSVGNYYGKAFSVRQWRRQPECENCGTILVEVRRIELEPEPE